MKSVYYTGLLIIGGLNLCFGQSALDLTYNPTMPRSVEALAIQGDGKLVTGAEHENYSSSNIFARFNVDGTTDSSYNFFGQTMSSTNHGEVSGISSVSCFMNGNVASSGLFQSVNGTYAPKILMVNEAGNRVSYYPSEVSAVDWVVDPYIVALPDNTAFVYSDFSMVGPFTRPGIEKLKTNAAVDVSFLPTPGSTDLSSSAEIAHRVNCMVQQPDGNVLIAGQFDRFNNQSKKYLVRVNSKGVLDSTFNPNPDGYCHSIALQPDGKILVTGFFTSIAGQAVSKIARLNTDGTLDSTFNCTVTSSGYIWCVIPRVDGKILVAGGFTSLNGVSRGRYALLESDGSVAPAYASDYASNYVDGMAVQNDGKVILAGGFYNIGASTRPYIARVNPDVPAVNTLTIDAEGKSVEWIRSGSAPEIGNSEFRISYDGVTYATVLGKGVRTATGWKLDKLALPGNKTFYIQAKGLSRGGVNNSSTSVMKSVDTFFRPLPNITQQPVGTTVVEGTTGVSFNIVATSAAAISYQWKLNGKAIAGATSATYQIPGGALPAHAGKYTCTLTTSAGVKTSDAVDFIVVTPLTITKQPVFQALLAGKTATFSVTVTGSTPQYQWQRNGADMQGETAATLKRTLVSSFDEAEYKVVITNFAGSVTSDVVRLYVVDVASQVTVPPASSIFAVGQPSATLTATVVSESPPVNQWLKNGLPIKGATSNTLSLVPVKLTSAGKYTLRTTNPAGTRTSDPVTEVAVVDQLSTKQFVVAEGGQVVLSAIASGNGLTYKWKKGASDLSDSLPKISGSQTKTMTLKGLTTEDTDAYVCEVTAPGGHLDSAVQQVTVTTGAPIILNTFDLPKGMVGADYDYWVPVDSTVELTPNKFVAKNLPPGLHLDSFSGHITGRPTTSKSYDVSITVSNSSAPGNTMTDTLEVLPIPNGLVGSFFAIIPADSTKPTFRQGGRLDFTSLGRGTYSGKLTIGTAVYPFKNGRLDVGVTFNHTNVISVARPKLTPLTLNFDVDSDTMMLTGSVVNGAETAPVNGWKLNWTKSAPAEQYKGYYTMALVAPAPPLNDFSYPHGDGYATFTVSDLGGLTVAGKLADGTGFITSSGFISPIDGHFAVYNPLYAPTGGAIWGVSTITPAGTAPEYKASTIAGGLTWLKYPQTSGHTYAAGFGPLSLAVTGSKYVLSDAGMNVIGSNPATRSVNVTFTGAHVEVGTPTPDLFVQLTDKNVFVVPSLLSGNNPSNTIIKLDVAKGLLTGVFTHGATAKVYGVVVRDQPLAKGKGYGFFTLLQPPATTTSETLSGKLSAN